MGVTITERTAPANSGPLVDTGQVFVVGAIGTGSTTAPAECFDMADFESAFAARSGLTGTGVIAWDWMDTFFHEGGNHAYVLDYASAGASDAEAALALLPAQLGAGQVVVLGETPAETLFGYVQAHCDANNRIGLLDVASATVTAAEVATIGGYAQALSSLENIGVFSSYVKVPAPSGVVGGSTRTIPASAVIAALCNRVDQTIGSNGIANYNQPAGGRGFPLQYVSDLVFDPQGSDQTTIFAAGANFFHDAWGVLENYGFVTPLYAGSQITETPFWQLNCSRARMWLKAQAQIVGETYYMQDIDGQGKLAAALGADLANLCKLLYDAGGLYGATPAEAYSINVGVTVNNDGTAATGTLNAVLSARFSQYAQAVDITLVSVPVLGVV